MTSEEIELAHGWAPQACTLPTVARPLRVAEFDELFASVTDVQRASPTVLRVVLDAAAEADARDLAMRETRCCSFFAFTFTRSGSAGRLMMEIAVPAEQVAVLDALAARAGRAVAT